MACFIALSLKLFEKTRKMTQHVVVITARGVESRKSQVESLRKSINNCLWRSHTADLHLRLVTCDRPGPSVEVLQLFGCGPGRFVLLMVRARISSHFSGELSASPARRDEKDVLSVVLRGGATRLASPGAGEKCEVIFERALTSTRRK